MSGAPSSETKKKFYAVSRGRIEGIFPTWNAASQSVTGYSGAAYKVYHSREEAIEAMQQAGIPNPKIHEYTTSDDKDNDDQLQQHENEMNPASKRPIKADDSTEQKTEESPDPTLFDPNRVTVITVTENNTEMKKLFNEARNGSDSVYPMHKPTRGIFLLIGNEYYKEARTNGKDLDDREGTGKDTIALDALFKQLHFKVVTEVNLKAQEMLEAVRLQASEVHPTDNCFACAILTHGERRVVYGVDGQTVEMDELIAAVTDKTLCPSLIGKPKIFFIQACQGKKVDSEGVATGGQELGDKFVDVHLGDPYQSDAPTTDRVSSQSDIFVAMATVPDFVSWRHPIRGTLFVQTVAFIFSQYAHKCHIGDLMIKVNEEVSQGETSKGYKQVPMQKTSLTRKLYFFPGLQYGLGEEREWREERGEKERD